LLSKIVVVVRNKMSASGVFNEAETKVYGNARCFNNERGELIVEQDGLPIAVFKEWIYWEKV